MGTISSLSARLGKKLTLGCLLFTSVVKSRLQAGKSRAERYRSTLHGLLTIFKEEGFQGLYGGAGSKLLQSVLTAAILFVAQKRIYDSTSKVVASLKKSRLGL